MCCKILAILGNLDSNTLFCLEICVLCKCFFGEEHPSPFSYFQITTPQWQSAQKEIFTVIKLNWFLHLLFKLDLCVCSFSFFCLFLYTGCQKKVHKVTECRAYPPPPPPCPPLATQLLAHIPPTLEQCRQVPHNSLVSHRYLWAMRTFLQVLLCKFTQYIFLSFFGCHHLSCMLNFHFFSKFVPRTPGVIGRQIGWNPACVCMQVCSVQKYCRPDPIALLMRVRACVCMCVCACARVCVCVCVRTHLCLSHKWAKSVRVDNGKHKKSQA